jgi:hypothetical protein
MLISLTRTSARVDVSCCTSARPSMCARMNAPLEVLIGRALAVIQQRRRFDWVQLNHFQVQLQAYRGYQNCPWSDDMKCTTLVDNWGNVQFSDLDWLVRNTRTGQEMHGPGLIIHLVRDHSFFEGLESPYRVDPSQLARLLELGPFAK